LKSIFPRLRGALLAGALAIVAAGCGPSGGDFVPRGEGRPNLLLVTVDTLRADHLSVSGYARATSPRIDRLAAEGVRFSAAQTQWPKTGPSFASIFTSTYPKDNEIVRQIGIPVPCDYTMLAEALSRHGYSTHAVVANGAVGREFYFDQGFETFLETWKLPPAGSELDPGAGGRKLGEAEEAMLRAAADLADPNGAENVTRLALEATRNFTPGKPWFLWVHYLDPHFPYAPPAAYRDRFQGDEHFDGTTEVPVSDRHIQELAAIGRSQVLDGETRLGFYVARYDAEIAYVDSEIGRLLDTMTERGLLGGETLTAFTSDHGESLGEHGYYFNHGRFGYQTCLNVPFILHWPGKIAPRVDRQPVELIHLAPTLLQAAGLDLPEGRWAQGRALWPRISAGRVDELDRVSFSEAGVQTHRRWLKMARDERFVLHYVQTKKEREWIGGADNEFPLFDLQADPGETKDVSAAFPAETERLKRQLSRWWNADRFVCETDTETCDENRAVDSETTEQLKALGYL
jgi:arylsulfatase A-like enzyme